MTCVQFLSCFTPQEPHSLVLHWPTFSIHYHDHASSTRISKCKLHVEFTYFHHSYAVPYSVLCFYIINSYPARTGFANQLRDNNRGRHLWKESRGLVFYFRYIQIQFYSLKLKQFVTNLFQNHTNGALKSKYRGNDAQNVQICSIFQPLYVYFRDIYLHLVSFSNTIKEARYSNKKGKIANNLHYINLFVCSSMPLFLFNINLLLKTHMFATLPQHLGDIETKTLPRTH